MRLVQISPNFHRLIGKHNVFFSYETPIAYYDEIDEKFYVSENIWSQTTGKHINKIKTEYANDYVTVINEDFVDRFLDYTS